jgi:hypothetical protein
MKRVTPETAASRFEAAVNTVEASMRAVVRAASVNTEILDEEKLRKMETFLANRLGDMMRDLGMLLHKQARKDKPFSLDDPIEDYVAPRTLLTAAGHAAPEITLGQSPARMSNGRTLTPVQAQRREEILTHGGRLIGGAVKTAEDDDDGVAFIEDEGDDNEDEI